MWKWVVRSGIAALVILVMASVAGPSANATVSGSGMCWVPDWEFPVPCADDEDD